MTKNLTQTMIDAGYSAEVAKKFSETRPANAASIVLGHFSGNKGVVMNEVLPQLGNMKNPTWQDIFDLSVDFDGKKQKIGDLMDVKGQNFKMKVRNFLEDGVVDGLKDRMSINAYGVQITDEARAQAVEKLGKAIDFYKDLPGYKDLIPQLSEYRDELSKPSPDYKKLSQKERDMQWNANYKDGGQIKEHGVRRQAEDLFNAARQSVHDVTAAYATDLYRKRTFGINLGDGLKTSCYDSITDRPIGCEYNGDTPIDEAFKNAPRQTPAVPRDRSKEIDI